MANGKCPHCNNRLDAVEIEHVQIKERSRDRWHGTSFVCPACFAVLGVSLDLVAIQEDIVKKISEQIRVWK